MITSFKLFEFVNKPNYFYLVLRNKPETYKELVKLKLQGLKGISDNYDISKRWFDVRDVLLIMNANDVLQLNTNLLKIEYDNIDLLLKNNLDLFIRIGHDDKGKRVINGHDYSISNAIHCILQDIKSNLKGQRLNNKLHEICSFLSSPEVYYKIEDYFEKTKFHIDNLNDLSKYVMEAIQKLPNIGDSYPWNKKYLDERQELTKNASQKEIEKILKIGITYRANAHKPEGEWYNYDSDFNIPRNSILFFKENVGRVIKYGTHGLETDEINSIIKEYNLDKYFTIDTVANHEEMKEILINQYY